MLQAGFKQGSEVCKIWRRAMRKQVESYPKWPLLSEVEPQL